MIAALLVVTLLKLAVALAPGGTADIPQQLAQARQFVSGRDTLDPTVSNPAAFLIGHSLLVAGSLQAAQATGMPFRFWIRVPAVLADLGIALLLLRLAGAGRPAALLYILSPVSVLLSVYHGQVHTVAAAFAFLALWLGRRGAAAGAGVALGLATSVRQHWAVLVVPLVRIVDRHAWAAAVGLLGVALLVNLPLLRSPHVWRTMAPPAGFGVWGYTIPLINGPRLLARLTPIDLTAYVPPLLAILQAASGALHVAWALAFVAHIWWKRPVDGWRAALLFVTGFFAITPSWGIQWLIWALPFWVVVSRRGALIFSGLAGSFLAVSYWVFRFNAKYRTPTITTHLDVLAPGDLLLYVLAGALGIATWAYCAWTAWQLWRAPVSDALR